MKSTFLILSYRYQLQNQCDVNSKYLKYSVFFSVNAIQSNRDYQSCMEIWWRCNFIYTLPYHGAKWCTVTSRLIFFSCGNKLSLANLDTKCMQRKENQDPMIHFRYTLHRKGTKWQLHVESPLKICDVTTLLLFLIFATCI